MKKILSAALSAVLLISSMLFASAVSAADGGTSYAAYITGNVNGHNSFLVDGSIYSAAGNYVFDNAGSNIINGNVDINTAYTYSPYLTSTVVFSGTVKTHTGSTFNAPLPAFTDFPTISNYIASKTFDWSGMPLTVNTNTHFGTLTVQNHLTVDTSNGDVTLVVDTLNLQGSGYIEITGSGSLYLFVKNNFNVSYSCSINKNGVIGKVTIFTQGNMKIDGAGVVNANVFMYNDNVVFDGSGILNGNIISHASTFSISGGGKVYGVVYTPNATAKVFSSGEINGRLVAKSLEIYGQGKIIYNPANGTVTFPDAAVKHSLTVNVTPSGKGTVSAVSGDYNYGTTVQLDVTPADGYRFKEFVVVSGNTPTADGKVILTQDTVISAVFEQIPAVKHNLTINVTPAGMGTVSPASGEYTHGDTIQLDATPAEGYRFKEFVVVSGNTPAADGSFVLTQDTVINAVFEQIPAVKHSLTINVTPAGKGTVSPASGEYTHGDTIQLDTTPAEGYLFKEFVVVSGNTPAADGSFVLTEDTVINAVFEEIDDGVPPYNAPIGITNTAAYIFGRDDTTMEAHDTIHRGEAAAVLYRLLKQNGLLGGFTYDIDATPAFADLSGRWDRSALEYMASIGIYEAAPTVAIAPDAAMTRGEAFKMFAIALKMTNDTTLTNEQYTAILVDAGYVEGFGDGGGYRIDENITRAQFCKIYNMITGRNTYDLVTADGTAITAATYGFTDLTNDWAYGIILRATSAFDANGKVDLEARGVRNVLDDYAN